MGIFFPFCFEILIHLLIVTKINGKLGFSVACLYSLYPRIKAGRPPMYPLKTAKYDPIRFPPSATSYSRLIVIFVSSPIASSYFSSLKMDVVLCSNEFDISSNSSSSVVHGCTTLESGFPLQSLSGGENSYAVTKNKILFSP